VERDFCHHDTGKKRLRTFGIVNMSIKKMTL
jgi:hypothetical protein